MKKIIISLAAIFISINIYSQTFTTIQDGTWTDPAIWDLGYVPDLFSDNVTVIVEHNITVSLMIMLTGNNTIITVNANGNLDVQFNNLEMLNSSSQINNYGTITNVGLMNITDGTLYNYGTFKSFSAGGSGEFFNYNNMEIDLINSDGSWLNYGSLKVFDINNLELNSSVINQGDIHVLNNCILYSNSFSNLGKITVDSYLEVNRELMNTMNGEIYVVGNTVMNELTFFANNGKFVGTGPVEIKVMISNLGLMIFKSSFTQTYDLQNDGAIYVTGNNNYVINSGKDLISNICGHVNVACGDFENNGRVTGSMNIIGNRTGAGTYEPSVTFNSFNPCTNDLITYISRISGNWDEAGVCAGAEGTWTIEGLEPDQIYEYPKNYFNTIIAGGHTVTAIAAGEIALKCKNLTIRPLGALTIETGVSIDISNDLTLESPYDSGAPGSLIDNGNLTVTGTSKMERYITGSNWHYIGMPVSNFNGNYFFPHAFYYYNEANNDTWNADDIYGVSGWTYGASGTLPVMEGYSLFDSDNNMLKLTGNFNTGAKSVSLSYTNNNPSSPQFDGWNLISNPYPSAIDWELVTTTGIIDNCLYFYDDDGSSPYYNNYRYYIKGGGGSSPYPAIAVNAGQQYIPAAQAFFVRTTTDGQIFNLDNSTRVHSIQDFYKNSEKQIHPNLLKLEVSGYGKADETIIRFIPESDEVFDNEFDAIKVFIYSDSIPQIYSITSEEPNQNLAVNTLPYYKNRIVDLGFKTEIAGSFVIKVNELNFDKKISVFLLDRNNHTLSDLRVVKEYPFTSENGNFTNRFEILFKKTVDIEDVNTGILVYSTENKINILQNNNDHDNLLINIYTIEGKLIKNISTNNQLTSVNVYTSGVYIVKIQTRNKIFSEKIVVTL